MHTGCVGLSIPKLAWRGREMSRGIVNGVTNPRPPLKGGRLAGLSSVPSKLERFRACGDPVAAAPDAAEVCTRSRARLEPAPGPMAPPGSTPPEGWLEIGSGVGCAELLVAEGMAEVSTAPRDELTLEEVSGGLALAQGGALLEFRVGAEAEPLLLWLDRVGDFVSLVCEPPPLPARGTRAGPESTLSVDGARDSRSFVKLSPAGFCEREKKDDMLFCFSSVSFSLSFLGPFGCACESESLDPANGNTPPVTRPLPWLKSDNAIRRELRSGAVNITRRVCVEPRAFGPLEGMPPAGTERSPSATSEN